MRLVVFGLTISSSWGNGHATLWRGLARALHRRGHRLAFFERDVPYYAQHRDLTDLPGGALHLYSRLEDVRAAAERELAGADCALVTSFCPDGIGAAELVLASTARTRAFYDLDTPVTLERARAGSPSTMSAPADSRTSTWCCPSPAAGRSTSSGACSAHGAPARSTAGSIPRSTARPSRGPPTQPTSRTSAPTIRPVRRRFEQLFLGPARARPAGTFVLGGASYGPDFPWRENVRWVRHLPPAEHAAFFCSSPLTVNVTRAAMAAMGHCPSGRLFEAAACGTPVLSNRWEGLESFFEPEREVLLASTTEEALAALDLGPARLARVGRAARERALAEHTANHRVEELLQLLDEVRDAEENRAAPRAEARGRPPAPLPGPLSVARGGGVSAGGTR